MDGLLSVIIPAYNEEQMIEKTAQTIDKILLDADIPHELLFVNDGSADGTWEKIEHLGNVIIGNNVEIGACTTIDRAEMESTIIGNGVKIDNLCQIAHNVQIGDNTVMAAQCGIAGSTKIGRNCILAGQVGIAGHLTIADNTTIGAQAGIIGNIRKSGQVLLGSPALPVKSFMRSYAIFKQQGESK